MFQQLSAGNRNQGQQSRQQQEQQSRQQQEQQPYQPPKDWKEYLTDEEKQVLDSYGKEWGEVSEAEQIRTQAIARHTREQVLAEVNQVLAPIAEHIQESKVQTHFGRIRGAHEDFDTLKQGALQGWVNQQANPVIREAAAQVLRDGSAEQVIGLIDLYKKDVGGNGTGQSTGAAPNVPASSQVPANNGGTTRVTEQPTQPAKPPKPAANTRAASATAAVNTGSRGSDPRGSDPNDFDSGFAEELAGT